MRGQNFLLMLKEKEALWYCAQGEGGWKQWRRDISADIRVLFQFFILSARARARQPDLVTVTTVSVSVSVSFFFCLSRAGFDFVFGVSCGTLRVVGRVIRIIHHFKEGNWWACRSYIF